MAMIADDFNRADQTGLGTSAEGWSWAQVAGGGQNIASNRARSAGLGGGTRWRANTDLPASDHYVQAKVNTSETANFWEMGLLGRASGSGGTETFYYLIIRTNLQLFRVVNGSFGSAVAVVSIPGGISAGTQYTLRLEVEGSQVRGYVNGSLLIDFADGSPITSGVRAGQGGQKNTAGHVEWDDFEAGDLVVPPAAPTLVTPANAAVLTEDSPTFEWQHQDGTQTGWALRRSGV